LTKSEIISTNISFGAIDERYPGDGSCNLEAKDSIMIFSYEGVQVNNEQNLIKYRLRIGYLLTFFFYFSINNIIIYIFIG